MKKLTKVLLIVSLSLAGLGLVFCILGFALGVTLNDFNSWAREHDYGYIEDWGNLIDYRETWKWTHQYDDDEEYDSSDEIFEFESINNFSFDIRVGKVEIAEYDGDKVKVQTNGTNSQFSCYADDTTLIIDDQRRGNNKPALYIYIPQGTDYENIEIEIDTADLSIDSIAADYLMIEVGAGCMQVDKFTGGNIDLTCGAGEMILSGSITGENQIECGVGQITLYLDGKVNDFDYYLESGIGSIDLGGEVYTTIGTTKHISNDSDKSLAIHVGIGNINVSFR